MPGLCFLGETRHVFRKIVAAFILVPLAVVIVAFAVANRQTVTVSFDPISAASPVLLPVHLPLFIVIFAVLIIGVLVGGIATWLNQSAWRRIARKLDADMRALHDEIEALGRRESAPAEHVGLPVIPPRSS
jgi:uncharacterized membrane protein